MAFESGSFLVTFPVSTDLIVRGLSSLVIRPKPSNLLASLITFVTTFALVNDSNIQFR